MRWPWILLLSLAAVGSAQVLTPKAEPPMRPSSNRTEPTTALDWFRSADNLTNIRMPGSMPFHMKVTFQAFPGIDFAKPGQSTVAAGDGVYEETWLAPDEWRREVTFGSYHAVEIRANGVRKFHASSEYEPSRVLMLLNALLDPIPRNFLSPELEMAQPKWKLQADSRAGSQVIVLRFRRNSEYIPASSSFEFSLSGVLLRAVSADLVTNWRDQQVFAGKWSPRVISMGTRRSNLLTAAVALGAPGAIGPADFQLPGAAAAPDETLRPLQYYEVKPPSILPSVLPVLSLAETAITGRAVVDRRGVPHEVEVLDGTHGSIARDWVANLRQQRFTPATIDGSPCEFVVRFLPSSGPSLPSAGFLP